MIPIARNINECDLVPPPPPQPIIARGLVGWTDSDDHFDLGTDDNDGHTLVKVTLNRGKADTTIPEEGKAYGHQIYAQPLGPLYWIPPDGTHVLVCFPDGEMDSLGGAFILGVTGKSPLIQFKDSRAVLDMGPTQDLIIKAKSVTLSDHNSPAQFIQVGPPPQGGTSGITMCDSQGGGVTCQAGVVGVFGKGGNTLVQITETSFEVWQKDGSFINLTGGNFDAFGTSAYLRGSAVYLGKIPAVTTPALWGLTGPAGAPSTSVFISPT